MVESAAVPPFSLLRKRERLGRGLSDRLNALPPFSAEESQILDRERAQVRNWIAPRAEHYDRSAEFPWDNVRAINALGLNAVFFPEGPMAGPGSATPPISLACAS